MIGAIPPNVLTLEPEAIPTALKVIPRFVVWRAGPANENGKFPKIPIDVDTGNNVSAHQATNWLTFETALAAYRNGKCHGIGFVPAGLPIEVTSQVPMYVCAIDLDGCGGQLWGHEVLWNSLGQPYVEVSPSGNGLRMFMLSTEVLKGGNAGDGFEMYFDRQFVTITGRTLGGTLVECTDELKRLHDLKFSAKPIQRERRVNKVTPLEETPRNIARVWEWLSKVDADCDYATYRNVIWAVEALGWKSGDALQREWSLTAPHRYKEAALRSLQNSYEPADNHIGFGTLRYLARVATMPKTGVKA